MNYNRQPGRPIYRNYTQQHAISSFKAYLAFKRSAQYKNRFIIKYAQGEIKTTSSMTLTELEEQTAYYAYSAR